MRSISLLLALALAVTPFTANAQTMVCGPNGCTYQRAPVRSALRPFATVYRPVAASAPAVHYSRPVVVRRGLFGRRVATRYAAPVVSASYGSSGASASYGSSGGTARYQAASVYAAPSYGSSGGLAQPPAASEPPEVDQGDDFTEPAVSTPQAGVSGHNCPCGDDCQCGPNCQCETVVARVPPTEPITVLAVVPPVGVTECVACVPATIKPLTLVAMR